MSITESSGFNSVQKKRSILSRLFIYLIIFLFVILQLVVISAMAQSSPLYGNMEKLTCKDDIGIYEIRNKCLLLFEAYEGSPKYGILYNADTFIFDADSIVGKRGYIDRSYYELLKSGRLLYQLQSIDDSYFYVMSTDDGSMSITLVSLPPNP